MVRPKKVQKILANILIAHVLITQKHSLSPVDHPLPEVYIMWLTRRKLCGYPKKLVNAFCFAKIYLFPPSLTKEHIK